MRGFVAKYQLIQCIGLTRMKDLSAKVEAEKPSSEECMQPQAKRCSGDLTCAHKLMLIHIALSVPMTGLEAK